MLSGGGCLSELIRVTQTHEGYNLFVIDEPPLSVAKVSTGATNGLLVLTATSLVYLRKDAEITFVDLEILREWPFDISIREDGGRFTLSLSSDNGHVSFTGTGADLRKIYQGLHRQPVSEQDIASAAKPLESNTGVTHLISEPSKVNGSQGRKWFRGCAWTIGALIALLVVIAVTTAILEGVGIVDPDANRATSEAEEVIEIATSESEMATKTAIRATEESNKAAREAVLATRESETATRTTIDAPTATWEAMSEDEREEVRKGFHCLSFWDGSSGIFKDAVKEHLNDPNSLEEIETRIAPVENDRHFILMDFTAKNRFGGRIRHTAYGYLNAETCDDRDGVAIVHRIDDNVLVDLDATAIAERAANESNEVAKGNLPVSKPEQRQLTPDATLKAATDKPTSFGTGVQIVGKDVAPGEYRASPQSGVPLCFWRRLSSADSESNVESAIVGIFDAMFAEADRESDADSIFGRYSESMLGWYSAVEGYTYATIKSTDIAFDSYGCSDWESTQSRHSDSDPAPRYVFGGGTHLVGLDIAPGEYMTTASPESISGCSWERLSASDGEASSMIAADTGIEGTVRVSIERTDYAFTSHGCNQWEREDDLSDEVEVPAATPLPQLSPTPTLFAVPDPTTLPTSDNEQNPHVVELTLEKLVEMTRQSVIRVITEEGAGSGWIYRVDSDGNAWALTNQHVVGSQSEVYIVVGDGVSPHRGNVVATNLDLDLALVHICCDATWGELEFTSVEVKIGSAAMALGYPYRAGVISELSVSSGIVSSYGFDTRNDAWVVQTDAALNPGNSGGPLLNNVGQVIGAVTFRIATTPDGDALENLGFAVASRTILEWLDGMDANLVPMSGTTVVPTPLPKLIPNPDLTSVIVAIDDPSFRSLDDEQRSVLASALGIAESEILDVEPGVALLGLTTIRYSGVFILEFAPYHASFSGYRTVDPGGTIRVFGRVVNIDGNPSDNKEPFEDLTGTFVAYITVLTSGSLAGAPSFEVGVAVPTDKGVRIEAVGYFTTNE